MTDQKPAPFAEGGKFHDNVRNISKLDDSVLRASMKKIGWVQECPAIKDEHGVVIVGHRRLKIAAELGIPPVIEKLVFGDGPSGQAKRLELAAASNLGFQKMDKTARKKIAEEFTEMGWTQKQIADVLEISQAQVSKDLAEFIPRNNSNSTAKTTANPRGAGRKKMTPDERAAKKEVKKAAEKAAKEAATLEAEQAKPPKEVDPERGRVAGVDVKTDPQTWKAFNEQARREKKSATAKISELIEASVNPEIKVETLSLTAQEKIDIATRQRQKKLDQEFERRVQDEVKRRIDDLVLPHWKQKIEEAHKLYARRKGVMDKATYTKIRACLHVARLAQLIDVPETKLDANLAKRYNEAFNLFESLEKYLLDEKDSPSHIGDLPASLDEWDKVKREVAAARKAGRTAVRRR